MTGHALHRIGHVAGPFSLTLLYNEGVAFGLGGSAPTLIVLGVNALAALGICVLAWRGHLGHAIPAGIVVGGSMANLADRVSGGSVVDMVEVGWWPTFNVADVFIVSGIALLLVLSARSAELDRPEIPPKAIPPT